MMSKSSNKCHLTFKEEQLNLVSRLFSRQKMRALRAEQAMNLLSGLYSSLLPRWLQILYPFVQSKITLLKLRRLVPRKCSWTFFMSGRCSKLEEQMISRGQNLQRVDIVLKQVSLSIIWQRKISPFTVLYIANPTSFEQYSIRLIMCYFIFWRRPVVFCRLFLSEPLEIRCQLSERPAEAWQARLTLDIDLPVLAASATKDCWPTFEDESPLMEIPLSFKPSFVEFRGETLLFSSQQRSQIFAQRIRFLASEIPLF